MRSKPITIKVDGKGAELYCHLLTLNERPVPPAPTHYLVADIINRDLSIKRVTIYFNPADTWTPDQLWCDDKIKCIGRFIGENLRFLGLDPNTVGYLFWVMEIATNEPVYKSSIHSFCDWDNN